MDMRLTDGDGAQATAAVLEVSPSLAILVLSASDERDDVLRPSRRARRAIWSRVRRSTSWQTRSGRPRQGRAVFTPGLAGLVLGEYRRIARDCAGAAGPTVRP